MITYELAKQLKEAGFPEPVDGERLSCKHNKKCRECAYEERAYIPTLLELIEACILPRYGFNSLSKETHNWVADALYEDLQTKTFTTLKYIGDTPEEAVAELWLALSKK